MVTIKSSYVIKKKNILNEARANTMTLQELRFFSIYLSKINFNDQKTRVVRFSLADFKAIMELGRLNIDYLQKVTNSLLCKVINIPNERGGYTGFQLFKECTIDMDENSEWYIEIDAHDKALPFLFDFKDKYFSYHLWNALSLKSPNQLRMYEILKQYEKIGTRILSINDLKELLGIKENEYQRFGNFKIRVLDPCQKALAENTDITFSYEPHGKKGKGGKIFFLKFIINKNNQYVDQVTLANFIENHIEPEPNKVSSVYDEKMIFLAEACNNEFSIREIVVLYGLMTEKLPFSTIDNQLQCYDYLLKKYRELNMRSEKSKILHRFAYLKSLIGKE